MGGTVAPQPPRDIAPPKVCPDGSAPDANSNCPPITQGSKETSSTDQGGTTQSPDNTPSSKQKLPKRR